MGVFFDDLPNNRWINILLDDVDQLALVELSGLTIGLELDDPFIDQCSALFELPEFLSSPVLLIGWSE